MAPPQANSFSQFYLRQGYVLVEGLLPVKEVATLGRQMHQIFYSRALSLGLAVKETSPLYEIACALFTKDPKAYFASAKLTQYLPLIYNLVLSKNIFNVLQQLGQDFPVFSTRPVCHFIAPELVVEGGYSKTPPHQDWRSIQGSLDSITLWTPLVDVDADFFPLEVIPGSHRQGLLPSQQHAFGHAVQDQALPSAPFLPIAAKRGDVIFFSNFLIHRTGVQGRHDLRIAISSRYNNVMEETFIQRNYPNPYVYHPDYTLLDADFPKQSDIKKLFG